MSDRKPATWLVLTGWGPLQFQSPALGL